ncbi:hypothetical protein [Shimia ponticola]|uniref:hypothetical protein n=1 Tax=Shimia ponticola TaxID=2582893 RepID=UPI003D2B765C
MQVDTNHGVEESPDTSADLTAVLQDFDQFLKFCALVIRVSRSDGGFDAVRGVIIKDELFDALDGRLYGRCLTKDIHAVSVILDHPSNAPDLAFDFFQPSEGGVLVGVHLVEPADIPYGGIGISEETAWQPIT